jgi:hypothetical protein
MDATGRWIDSLFRSMQSSDAAQPTAPKPDDLVSSITAAQAARQADGPVVTVTVPATPPEQAARLRDQISQILEENLGSQRAKLLTDLGGGWLDEAWGHPAQFGISVTVMRHPDGTYMFGNSSGGFADDLPAGDVPQHIPDYLRPFFTDILNPPAAADPVANPQANQGTP